jgi:hypothetical protein
MLGTRVVAMDREHEATGPAPAEEARTPAPSGPLPGAAPWLRGPAAGLDHATAAAARTAMVLGAQHGQGNAWVARALAQRQPAPDGGAAPAAPGAPGAPAALIVEDTEQPQPGQLTRSGFLAQLRPAVVTEATAALDNPLLALSVEPAVDAWLAGYQGKDAAGIERTIRAELPGAAGLTDARQLVPAICARVRAEVQQQEQARQAPEGGVTGAIADVAGLLFSRRPDAPARKADPLGVLRRLGRGRPLDSSVRGRLEPLLGRDFSDVRVHAGGEGAEVAGEHGARALAVGRDIAFGAGEYRPGTPVGDALLAHELAHVAQDSGAQAAGGALGAHSETALEHDADDAAAGAVTSLWGDRAPAQLRRSARPRLTGGLALRSCGGAAKKEDEKAAPEAAPANPKAVYEQKLKEGVQLLAAASFGRAEVAAKFNRDYFETELDEENSSFEGEGQLKLVLRRGKAPSKAIDATFANPGEWSVDCAEYVQLAELYALRHSLGATEFNQRVKTIRLTIRPHGSTLLEDLSYWNREGAGAPVLRYTTTKGKTGPGAPEKRSMDQVLADAPIGSRVMWTNVDAPSSHPWHNENTVKIGPDLFAAHGIQDGGRKTFSRAEVEQGMAREFLKLRKRELEPGYVASNVYLKQVEVFDQAKALGGPAPPP